MSDSKDQPEGAESGAAEGGDYWLATDDPLKQYEGKGPTCAIHPDEEMVPEDDHGRFICMSCLLGGAQGGLLGRGIAGRLPYTKVSASPFVAHAARSSDLRTSGGSGWLRSCERLGGYTSFGTRRARCIFRRAST